MTKCRWSNIVEQLFNLMTTIPAALNEDSKSFPSSHDSEIEFSIEHDVDVFSSITRMCWTLTRWHVITPPILRHHHHHHPKMMTWKWSWNQTRQKIIDNPQTCYLEKQPTSLDSDYDADDGLDITNVDTWPENMIYSVIYSTTPVRISLWTFQNNLVCNAHSISTNNLSSMVNNNKINFVHYCLETGATRSLIGLSQFHVYFQQYKLGITVCSSPH